MRRPSDLATLQVGEKRIRPTRAEIDLGAVTRNVTALKSQVGTSGVLAVIKADAYGHGAVPVGRALAEAAPILGLAVSLAEEGIELRRAGLEGQVLVMGGVYAGAHREIVALDLIPVVSELSDIEAFAKAGGTHVHLKLDTGMSRLGVRPEQLDAFLAGCARYPDVRITGFCTHLASADSDPVQTHAQLARFRAAIPAVERAAGGPLLLHVANSAGIAFPEAHFGAVRPGLSIYKIEQAMRFVTSIVQLRDVNAGDTVSYGALWQAARPSRIATLPAGYADGYPRRLTNHAHVLIHGIRCPIVGAVCMDMTMVDVTALGERAAIGDEVVLLGRQGDDQITALELAQHAGLIEYEITCGISKRVPRMYTCPSP